MPDPIPFPDRAFELLDDEEPVIAVERGFSIAAGDLATAVSQLRHKLARKDVEIARLRELLGKDWLTGAATMAVVVETFRRLPPGESAGVVVLDIDGFHEVNARGGRRVGDAVLRATAVNLRRLLRVEDVVARSGGDEFTVLLPQADAAVTVAVADRLRATIEQIDFRRGDLRLRLSLSVGLASRVGTEGLDALLQRADEAMCRARQWGSGRPPANGPPRAGDR